MLLNRSNITKGIKVLPLPLLNCAYVSSTIEFFHYILLLFLKEILFCVCSCILPPLLWNLAVRLVFQFLFGLFRIKELLLSCILEALSLRYKISVFLCRFFRSSCGSLRFLFIFLVLKPIWKSSSAFFVWVNVDYFSNITCVIEPAANFTWSEWMIFEDCCHIALSRLQHQKVLQILCRILFLNHLYKLCINQLIIILNISSLILIIITNYFKPCSWLVP